MKKEKKKLNVSIRFDNEKTESLALRAFLFDKNKKLIESTSIKNGKANFKTTVDKKSDAIMLIAPDKKETEKETNFNVLQSKFKAYKPVIELNNANQLEILPIPDSYFPWWNFRSCRVTGNVSKFFDINGFRDKKGLCDMRVHICEVDRIRWLIPRIPDDIIVRIPDLVLNPELPMPVPVLPDPPFPPVRNFDSRNKGKLGNIFTASKLAMPKLNMSSDEISQQLSNSRQSITTNDSITKVLQTKNPALIRKAMLSNFELFHPIICWTPWLWPYFYKCDELAVAYTDRNGDFDSTIFYNIFGDHPDLYFWVEAFIDNQWTTVYKPTIPCNTYWNYNCGTPVNITVTDDRVRWECSIELEGEFLWVKTVGNYSSVAHIEQEDTTGALIQGVALNRQGLTDSHGTVGDYRRPFGTSLNFQLQFGNRLSSNRYAYYRWSYRKVKNADLSIAAGTVEQLGNLVQKTYSFNSGGGSDYDKVKLGPFDVNGQLGIYRIPTASPVEAPFNIPAGISPFWDQNTISITFDSRLDGDGLYEFTLELFDENGNKVINIPNELFHIPNYNTFVPSVNAPNENLVNNGANTCSAYKMLLRIDNSRTEADILQIKVDGVFKNPTCCGFVPYSEDSEIEITFRAYHPHNFATFNFDVQKGTCDDSVQSGRTNADGMVIGNVNGYIRDVFSYYTKTFTPSDLLGLCNNEGKAAFAEYLYVNALATNGTHEINAFDSSALAAFALEPDTP